MSLVESAAWIGLPSIVVGELLAGFLAGGQWARDREELDLFLANPALEEIPVDHEVAHLYAEIVASLKAAGAPLPTSDSWIAAAAARAGAPLLTFDEHFREVARVGTILLQADAG